MISCLASSSDWTALFSLLSTKTRSCSFSNRRRTFFMLSQPTPCPSKTLCTTSFKNCWFSLDENKLIITQNFMCTVFVQQQQNYDSVLYIFIGPRQRRDVNNAPPCVVDSTLRRGRFSLHRWAVFNHWRLLVHECSRCPCSWKNNKIITFLMVKE